MPCSNYSGRDVNEDPIFGNLEGTKCIQWESKPIDSCGTYTFKNVFKTIYGSYVDEFKGNIDQDTKFTIATYLYYHNDGHVYYFGSIEDAKEFQSTYGPIPNLKQVEVETVKTWYPKSIDEVSQYFFQHLLDKQQYYGEWFEFSYEELLLACFAKTSLEDEKRTESMNYILKYFYEQKWIPYCSSTSIQITPQGMKNFYEQKSHNRNAFVALSFADINQERIETIENAIRKAGYIPVNMMRNESNGWIMPEIFKQIRDCRFVVADFSIPCNGAYYEAGYALALGKEVIHMFDQSNKDENHKLHFDIAQKNTVMYNGIEDLSEKLIKRIKATVDS